MRIAAYALLSLLAGCSRATCRGGAEPTPPSVPLPVPAPSASAPPSPSASASADPGEIADGPVLERLEVLRRGGRTLAIQPPSEQEERAFEAWIVAVAKAAVAGGPPPERAPRGFELKEIEGGLWVLAEKGKKRRGAGAFVVRVGRAAPLLVEAPHTFFDQGTLPLATSLFEAQRARALLINTAHRYGGKPKPPDVPEEEEEEEEGEPADAGARRAPPPPSDVAHAERSFFQAAHRGLLEALPGVPTVQLHGFQDISAPDVSVIVSASRGRADLEVLLGPLRAALPDREIRAYPTGIKKLGGELNMQARWSASKGAPFYHLELSRSIRDVLVEDRKVRRRFVESFSALAAPRR